MEKREQIDIDDGDDGDVILRRFGSGTWLFSDSSNFKYYKTTFSLTESRLFILCCVCLSHFRRSSMALRRESRLQEWSERKPSAFSGDAGPINLPVEEGEALYMSAVHANKLISEHFDAQ
jgi:hypothetical protein